MNTRLMPWKVSSDDQVKAYIKKIMSQLNKWMLGGKISKLVVVITSKETGEHVERWQFDVSHSSFGSDTGRLIGGTGANLQQNRKEARVQEKRGQGERSSRVGRSHGK